MLEFDPFNVKQVGGRHSKWLRALLVGVPVLLLLSFLFFLLSFATSRDDEVSSINYGVEVIGR